EPDVYLQGSANGDNWGTSNAVDRFTVPELSEGANAEFVSPAFAAPALGESDGGVRASIILPGYEWWHTEFIVIKGDLEYRGKDGDQERVSGSTGQRLYINFTAKTGSIK
ncbi:SusF/SusE family outer membrane protein, partial [termite gut metagenome]